MAPVRLSLETLREGVPHPVDAGGTPLVLIRQGAEVVALSGKCPHAGAPLEGGAVCGGRLICPWHKAAFALDTGDVLEPPALTGLQRYAVRLEGGDAVVDGHLVARPPAAPPQPRGPIAIIGTGRTVLDSLSFDA